MHLRSEEWRGYGGFRQLCGAQHTPQASAFMQVQAITKDNENTASGGSLTNLPLHMCPPNDAVSRVGSQQGFLIFHQLRWFRVTDGQAQAAALKYFQYLGCQPFIEHILLPQQTWEERTWHYCSWILTFWNSSLCNNKGNTDPHF